MHCLHTLPYKELLSALALHAKSHTGIQRSYLHSCCSVCKMGFTKQGWDALCIKARASSLIFTFASAENASEKGTDERPNSFHVIKEISVMRIALKLFYRAFMQSLGIKFG